MSSASQMPTAVASAPARSGQIATPSSPIGRLQASEVSSQAAFAPGEMLAGRYRIIGLIGRGGMGDVYRADDVRLAQPVSLKFLPGGFAGDAAWLERFHAEVRNSRQVSHPNVCRVYDIGEADGHHFISMEFVDGEDLATLLHRIGRLPAAKANEVAQQLCAGLAAAHDKGVLHRDLKPSNVMIDGHGRVRITDFGLAVRVEDGTASEIAGTPAYMSPEQFGGGAITVRSDIYSLGLILYEIYTGKRAFEAASVAEWRRRHAETPATPPSQIDRGIDEAVERAILRCLEKDPSKRPASALQLAASLPGGDPLSAALAAGETPSPEMVAAAGGEGAMAPRTAWSLLAAVLLLTAAIVALSPHSTDLGLAPLRKSPEALRGHVQETLARVGYAGNPADVESWLERDSGPMKYLADSMKSPQWRRGMGGWGVPLLFHYRQSPRWMIPQNIGNVVQEDDPPHEISGMVSVKTDAEGRLRMLRAVPPQLETADSTAREPDWDALFAAAGLDRSRFAPAAPRWVPPEPFDARREWTGSASWAPDVKLRVSAAGYRGKPVYLEVLGPWSRAERMQQEPTDAATKVARAAVLTVLFILLGVCGFFAWRNFRLDRGDRRGARALALVILALLWTATVVGAHHVADPDQELQLLLLALASGMLSGAFYAFIYLALEPYVRRTMPELLIGWARLFEGRFRDPRVGRDFLIGAVFGAVLALASHVTKALPAWFPFRGATTIAPDLSMLAGGGRFAASLALLPILSLAPAMIFFALYFLLRLTLRRPPLAMAGLIVITVLISLSGENLGLRLPELILYAVLLTFVVARFGLLAAVGLFFTNRVLTQAPLPPDFLRPYAVVSVVCLLVFVAVIGYAFRISLGSRPVFGSSLDA